MRMADDGRRKLDNIFQTRQKMAGFMPSSKPSAQYAGLKSDTVWLCILRGGIQVFVPRSTTFR